MRRLAALVVSAEAILVFWLPTIASAHNGMFDLDAVGLPTGGWVAFRLSAPSTSAVEISIQLPSQTPDVVAGLWHERGRELVGAMLAERSEGEFGPELFVATGLTGGVIDGGEGGSRPDGPFAVRTFVVGSNEIVVVAVSSDSTVVLAGEAGVSLVARTSGLDIARYRQRDFSGEANVSAGVPPFAMTKFVLNGRASRTSNHRMFGQLWDYVVTGASDVAIDGPTGAQHYDASWATAGSWLLVHDSPPGE